MLVVNDAIVRAELGTVLNNIVDSFCKFKGKFSTIKNNYLYMSIYCNASFGYGRGLMHKLDDQFFEINGEMAKRNSVIGLTWSNLTINGRILTRIEMHARLGLYLTDEKYLPLKTAYKIATRKYH
jgi:hypothetical protein